MDKDNSQEKIDTSKKEKRNVDATTFRNNESYNGQARKSTRGMPWHRKPTKDVISCEKLRGIANRY